MSIDSISKTLSQELILAGQFVAKNGWCPATGGNFSARIDESHCLITQSGKDKSDLSMDDLMVVNFQGEAQNKTLKPSAEVALHTRLYQLDRSIACVLHTHSINSTVLSRQVTDPDLQIQGYEMQKALAGNTSHESQIQIKIFDNDQNMLRLADNLANAWLQGEITQPGVLVRGHGLYAWGTTIAETQRHIAGIEFLLACLWQDYWMNRRA
jgi:methylthioribulose-1-phosphate dehydratase